MSRSYGWAGRVLQVDLTERKIRTVPTSDFEPEHFIGGQGLNSKIFWEMGCPKVDAFHPYNPLMIANGLSLPKTHMRAIGHTELYPGSRN